MNPITNIRNLNKINEREIALGVAGQTSKSWHQKYADSAWIFVGGLPYQLTEGDVIAVFSQSVLSFSGILRIINFILFLKLFLYYQYLAFKIIIKILNQLFSEKLIYILEIYEYFFRYGEVVNINLIRDQKTGKSKGFGFLCYEDQRSTILSVDNLNGTKVKLSLFS